jgi:DNA repair protein RadC
MKEFDQLHLGHRQRLREKFLTSPDIMSEHELLEIILFDLLPRKNTNELAHKLLRAFGSIEGVIFAKPQELTQVDGIGKNIATKLISMGVLVAKLTENRWKKVINESQFAFPLIRDRVVRELTDHPTENMVAYMFDKNDQQIGVVKFSDGTETNIKVDYLIR